MKAKKRKCDECGCDLTARIVPCGLRRPPAIECQLMMVGNGSPIYFLRTWCPTCAERVLVHDAQRTLAEFWRAVALGGKRT